MFCLQLLLVSWELTAEHNESPQLAIPCSSIKVHRRQQEHFKAWRNWPTLPAKHYCSRPNSNVCWLSIANDTETNNSVWQAMLAGFARPLYLFNYNFSVNIFYSQSPMSVPHEPLPPPLSCMFYPKFHEIVASQTVDLNETFRYQISTYHQVSFPV